LKIVNGLLFGIDKINEFFAKMGAWVQIALILVLVIEVTLRYVFGLPTLWVYDISWMLSSILIMWALGYTWRMKGHVSIDIFYEKFPLRVRAFLDVFFAVILFFPLMYVIIDNMIPHLIYSWTMGERAIWSVWLPVVYPFKTWVFIGVVILALQGVAEFIRDLKVLIVGGERL